MNNEDYTFESILQQLLEEYEKDPSRNIDEMLAEKLKTLGASDECLAEVKETTETIDKFAEKASSLEEARNEGKSRATWLREQIDNSLDGLEEETKVTVLNAVGETVEKKTNEMFNQ